MSWLAWVLVAIAVVTIIGGVMGFAAGSVMSLVGSAVVALLLLGGAYVGTKVNNWGFLISLAGCLFLVFRFLPAYQKSHAVWPALTMVILGGVGIVAHVVGHFTLGKVR